MAPDITHALGTAPARYASGVDRRDPGLFLSAFHPEGSLRIPARGPDTEARVLRGHSELAAVIERIARYDRTFHLLGQTRLEWAEGMVAKAETYCVAHHWLTTEERHEDTVLYIRYEDTYRLGDDGEWRFTERSLHEEAREVRDVTGSQHGAVAS